MTLVEAPEPGAPGPGEVIVRSEAVGFFGSDFHYFTGDLGAVPQAKLYPRIQGHEAAGGSRSSGRIARGSAPATGSRSGR
jgi:threonine dehydrogenase-like Zn-dependent dehydrogenase